MAQLNLTDLHDNNPSYELLNADGTPRPGSNVNMAILQDNQPYFVSAGEQTDYSGAIL